MLPATIFVQGLRWEGEVVPTRLVPRRARLLQPAGRQAEGGRHRRRQHSCHLQGQADAVRGAQVEEYDVGTTFRYFQRTGGRTTVRWKADGTMEEVIEKRSDFIRGNQTWTAYAVESVDHRRIINSTVYTHHSSIFGENIRTRTFVFMANERFSVNKSQYLLGPVK